MKLSKKKKWIIGIVVIVVFVVIIINVVMGTSQTATPVNVATVSGGNIVERMDFSGTVMTEETKVYFAPVAGTVATVDVAVGDRIQEGDCLMTYDMALLEEQSRVGELQAEAEAYGIDATIKTIQKAQSDQAQAVHNYEEAMAYVNHYSACLESATRQYNEAMAVKTEYETLKAKVDQYKIQQAEYEEPNAELANLISDGEARLDELSAQMAQYDYAALEGAVTVCSNDLNEYKALAQQYKAEKIDDPSLSSQRAQQAVLQELNDYNKQQAQGDLETAAEGVKADFDGVVTQVDITAGQTLPEGMQMFALQSTENLKVSVDVTKYDMAQIQVGQTAVLTINGREYMGTVTKINGMAQLNASGASVVTADIHINNPDENIYLGIEAKVQIQSAEVENALLLPIECVNYDTRGSFCYTVEDGVIVRRDVEVGISSDTQIQILSGLEEGTRVVSEVTTDLTEGMEVSPITE